MQAGLWPTKTFEYVIKTTSPGRNLITRKVWQYRLYDPVYNELRIWVGIADQAGEVHLSRVTALEADDLARSRDMEGILMAAYMELVRETEVIVDVFDALEV